MIYQLCPRCGEHKAIRMVGSYEPDTNAGEELEYEPRYSCPCNLTADEWETIMAGLSTEDFIHDYDY